MAASIDQESSFDPRRRLCPDGGCIGIIGSDGKCSVCGAADPAGVPSFSAGDTAAVDDLHDEADAISVGSGSADTSASDFDPNRRLCSDDSCIGVVGSDNRCSVCGRIAGG